MLLQWLGRISLSTRLARAGLLIATIAIAVLALMPAKEVPITTSWDKLDHWLAFFTLSFLANHSFPQRSYWRVIAVALVAYGIGIEIAQWITPDRDADPMDVIADSIGIIIYGAVLFVRGWLVTPQRAE